MSKYAPFGEFLSNQEKERIHLSFGDVEKILKFKLPDSAYGQRSWWSNNLNNNVMTRVWRNAGYRTQYVDMKARKVVFQRRKPPTPRSPEEMQKSGEEMKNGIEAISRSRQSQPNRAGKHPLRGALKGVLRLVGGTDLTKPADPDWGGK